MTRTCDQVAQGMVLLVYILASNRHRVVIISPRRGCICIQIPTPMLGFGICKVDYVYTIAARAGHIPSLLEG